MKIFKYLALGGLLAMSTTSCQDWLDVNTDPDNPNNETATLANRLPWIEKFYLYTAGVTNMRTSCTANVYYSFSGNPNSLGVTWACAAGATTTPYQTFFTTTGANLVDLYNKAEAEGAYHYMAMANIFHALGFMEMLDLYGEMPYTDALGSSPVPTYDDGKTIFYGCIDKLDKAIELLGMQQEPGATLLSTGDFYNNGDVSKWIKLCYGLKARYLLKLSKKAEFDPQAILDCLAKAPQSNADNTEAPCHNVEGEVTDWLFGDPIMTNGNWDYVAYGNYQRIAKFHYDMLVNMRGAGVEDPRFTKIVPAFMSNIKLDSNGQVASYEWFRSLPVDVMGEAERLLAGGATSITNPTYADKGKDITYKIEDAAKREKFIADMTGKHALKVDCNEVTVTYQAGSIYVNSANYVLAGDTAYVNMRSNSTSTKVASTDQGEKDVNWYYGTAPAYNAGAVGGTGSYQVRPISDQEIVTYHEMCFIKAEVLFRKGDKAGALAAYKQGIQAHIDMMQEDLIKWEALGYNNPDMWPMDEAQISAYMSSAAVCQDASELTMSDIMLQKFVAMGCSIENWNDMRRFNFSAGNIENFGVVYPGYDRGPLFKGQSQITGTNPTDPTYWIRRWRLPGTLELSYNKAEALKVNPRALDTNIWCVPIWWDCASDDEYYNYLK